MTPEELDAVAAVIADAIRDALAPVLERLAGIDVRLEDLTGESAAVGPLRERLAVVEEKAKHPPAPLDVTPVLERLANELRGECAGLIGEVMKDVVALRIQAAGLEARAPVPGPAGEPGRDGAKGLDGKDGRNGTIDEMGFKCVPVTERSFQLYAGDGEPVEGGLLTFPVDLYRGVFVEGKAYEHGDCVTWGGSMWHANEATTSKPGDGSKAWTLTVKRGQDGRDGKDAPGALPVVKVGGR